MLKILPVLQSLFRNKKFLALLIAMGLVIKLLMIPFIPEPGDYTFFLKPWVEFIRSHGYWQAFRFIFLAGNCQTGRGAAYSDQVVVDLF